MNRKGGTKSDSRLVVCFTSMRAASGKLLVQGVGGCMGDKWGVTRSDSNQVRQQQQQAGDRKWRPL